MRSTLPLLTALLLAPLAAVHAADQPVRRPNILFLLTDDQRWDTLGCMGNAVVRTAEIDRLAAEGVLFRNAFVTTSVCSASRTSILTGQHARSRGVGDLNAIVTPVSWADTLPALLRKAGYSTGHIGKWDVGPGEEGFQRGAALFDYWAGDRFHGNYWHEKSCPFVTSDGVAAKGEIKCTCPPDGSIPRTGHKGMKHPLHTDLEIVPIKARQFLVARDPAKPFYLSISFRGPKDPWGDCPPSMAALYEAQAMPASPAATKEAAARQPEFIRNSLGGKAGMELVSDPERLATETRKCFSAISSVDAAVGKLRQLLAETGLADNTVILFVSDNGMMIGDHGLRGKWLPHESSIRVPLIVHDPRLSPARRGAKRDEMVLNIDWAPTMLSLAGCQVPTAMQGRDFTPLLAGAPASWREEWYYEHSWTADGRIPPCEALRTAEWKLMRFPGEQPPVEQLFDIKNDPNELHDLIAEAGSAPVVAKLRARLEVLRRKAAKVPVAADVTAHDAAPIAEAHYSFGTAVTRGGNVLFTEFSRRVIQRWNPLEGRTDVWRAKQTPGMFGLSAHGTGDVFVGIDLGDKGNPGKVLRIGADGEQAHIIEGITRPRQLACDAAGNLFVALEGGKILKWERATHTTTELMTAQSPVNGIAVGPDGSVFVGEYGHFRHMSEGYTRPESPGVVKVRRPDGTITVLAGGFWRARGIALSGAHLYLCTEADREDHGNSGLLVRIDTLSGKQETLVEKLDYPQFPAADAQGKIYFTLARDNKLMLYDPASPFRVAAAPASEVQRAAVRGGHIQWVPSADGTSFSILSQSVKLQGSFHLDEGASFMDGYLDVAADRFDLNPRQLYDTFDGEHPAPGIFELPKIRPECASGTITVQVLPLRRHQGQRWPMQNVGTPRESPAPGFSEQPEAFRFYIHWTPPGEK